MLFRSSDCSPLKKRKKKNKILEILDDWSIFIGNPVKVGLGMVSMVFDVIFMVQHYCLYRNADEGVILNTSEENITNELDQSDINILPEVVRVNDEQHIII
ncbi:unnamed protein product [Onchocerca flexuosa]|uniref:Transmembrane protein n=1 Tax=Onchocerca flexuosa TaxID=387005 RepID=A0A183HH56_9BILA|nr:unnamed protein product [Onchocerca flexuosa]